MLTTKCEACTALEMLRDGNLCRDCIEVWIDFGIEAAKERLVERGLDTYPQHTFPIILQMIEDGALVYGPTLIDTVKNDMKMKDHDH